MDIHSLTRSAGLVLLLSGCSDAIAPDVPTLVRSGPDTYQPVESLQQTSPFTATGVLTDGTGFVALPSEAGGPDDAPFVIVIFRRPGQDFYTFTGGAWGTFWSTETGSWITLIQSEAGREYALFAHW